MLERIEEILRDIEENKQEIQILLNMCQISFLDFILHKRGDKNLCESISLSVLSQLEDEADKLKKNIDALFKIRKEVL